MSFVSCMAISVRLPPYPIALDVGPELGLAHLERLVGLSGLADLHRIVLPHRMPFPVLGHQQAPQVSVALEHDAEHVPRFTLGPSRAAPDALHRRQRSTRRHPHLQSKP